jgi:uncharacterized membrane protein
MTLTTILDFALFAYALTRVPDKYKPAWMQHFNSLKTWIGLVALIAAILIVLNPEFYALGIIGDSAFFDLLVLAIGLQLQTIVARVWGYVALGFSVTRRMARWRLCVGCSVLLFTLGDLVSSIQKVMQRISS